MPQFFAMFFLFVVAMLLLLIATDIDDRKTRLALCIAAALCAAPAVVALFVTAVAG